LVGLDEAGLPPEEIPKVVFWHVPGDQEETHQTAVSAPLLNYFLAKTEKTVLTKIRLQMT
jgi:hypothetical protein